MSGSAVADARPVAGAAPPTTRTTPPSWKQAIILARFQLRDYLRAFRFSLMMGIVGAIGVIITILLVHFRPAVLHSASAFYGSFWTGGVVFVMVVAVIIYGGDAIAGEFQNRTGYFLLGLPVRRAAVYAGKFLASFAACVVAVLFYLAILVADASYFLGGGAVSDPGQLVASLGLALLYLLAVLGTAFLFSSLFKQSLFGVLVVLFMFLIGWNILTSVVTSLFQTEPWFVISYAAPVIGYPLTGTPQHLVRFGALVSYSPTLGEGIAIMLGYFVVTSLLGLLLFEREEFT